MASGLTPLTVYHLSEDAIKGRLSGTLISGVTYGIVLVLSGKCCRLLSKTKYIYSKKMRRILFIYITSMLSLSTAAMVEELLYLGIRLFRPNTVVNVETNGELLFSNDIPLSIPIAIWGADGFMLWRCFVLYQGVSTMARVALFCLLSTISIISLGSGLLFFFPYQIEILAPTLLASPFISWLATGQGVTAFAMTVTPFVNAILAALIVGRLLSHQYYIMKTLGTGHETPYNRIMTMCVESCALIAASSVLYIGLAYSSSTSESSYAAANGFPLLMFPHVCVISPFLIIARVAEGRSATILQPSEVEPHITAIRFDHTQSNQTSGEINSGLASPNV